MTPRPNRKKKRSSQPKSNSNTVQETEGIHRNMTSTEQTNNIAEESHQHIGSHIRIEPIAPNASFNQVEARTAAENGFADYCNQQHPTLQSLVTEVDKVRDKNAQLSKELHERELEIRKLNNAQKALEQLQDEVLSSIDRFQPAFDTDVTKAMKGVELKARPLISFLAKQSTKLSPTEWQRDIIPWMWEDSLSAASGVLDFSNKEIRRKVLKNIFWAFLEQNLFHRPFMCFGGPLTDHLDGLYKALYPDPHENDDSAKWRAMTVQQLKAQNVEKFNGDVQSHLMKDFESILRELGYEVNETELRKKMNEVLFQAISFAQLVAGQRAIFGFFVPKRKDFEIRKKEDDELMTNIDGEFPEVQEELARDVWFVVKPGLAKWGTGSGKNLDESTVLIKSYVELVD